MEGEKWGDIKKNLVLVNKKCS